MKNLVKAAIAAAVLGLASSANAGGTHTVSVSASISGTCVVNTANSTLAFGTLDPVGGGTVNVNGSAATFRCTTGTPYTVTSDDGQNASGPGGTANRMKVAGATDCTTATNCIRYTMTNVTSGTGSGMTTNISFGVTGQTTLADYTNAKQGAYSDTVTLTVSP